MGSEKSNADGCPLKWAAENIAVPGSFFSELLLNRPAYRSYGSFD